MQSNWSPAKISLHYRPQFGKLIRVVLLCHILTFTVVQCIQLLYVCLTEALSLTELQAGLFDGLYCALAIFGESVTPVMHQALEVVHGAKIVEFTMRVLVEIVRLTCDSKKNNENVHNYKNFESLGAGIVQW